MFMALIQIANLFNNSAKYSVFSEAEKRLEYG